MIIFMIFISKRPSTPIQELLEYKYQDAWIDQQRRLLQARNQQAQVKVCNRQ